MQPWPGNIRELENWVHREVLMGSEATADGDPAPPRCAAAAAGTALPSYREAREQALQAFVKAVMAASGQDVSALAAE